jgi:hypothetical protein
MGEVAEWTNAAAYFLKVVTPVSRRRGFDSLPSPLAGSASVKGWPFRVSEQVLRRHGL